MKKFVNHVDHAVYISRWETVDANVAQLEFLVGATMERFVRSDMGCVVCVDWSAGLEIVAPTPERVEANEALHARLETHGEGLLAVVYAVADLEEHRAEMAAKGIQLGPLMTAHPDEPWSARLTLRERFGPSFLNSWMVFSEIDYQDDEIRFQAVKPAVGA